MKTLYLGDPHVQVSNLEESERLMQFVYSKLDGVDQLTILGDLFHNMAIVRVEVLDFWDKWLKKFNGPCEVVILVGNHDQASRQSNPVSALDVFITDDYRIINEPTYSNFFSTPLPFFGYLPYIHNNEEFIAEANKLVDMGARVLVVHADFDGAQYENGHFAPNGVKQELIDPRCHTIISGHIHSSSRFGRVIYPGTARWLTTSEANQAKGLWLVEHDDKDGRILNESFIDTSRVCTPIISIQWKQGEDMPPIPLGNIRLHVELIGTSDWVKEQKAQFAGKASVKAKITDTKYESRKSVGNMSNFIENVFQTTLDKKKLLEFMRGEELV